MQCTKEMRLSYTEQAQNIVNQMTLEEKVKLMSGWLTMEDILEETNQGIHYNNVPYPAGGNLEKGVEPIRFCDGPRGVVCGTGESTCFPVPMCRGASFDTELETEIGHAIGREIRGHGGNLFGGVCINAPYNPGWGRSQETFGEDPCALGKMGSALVEGIQAENVIACVKHLAFYSIECSRFKVSVDCDRRTEREVYLPHFKECIDAGAACVMSSYNRYKSVHCGQNEYLLRKVLKEEWDFDGFVISDFFYGVKDTIDAANAGMDIEMFNPGVFGESLIEAVNDGRVDISRVDEAALRIVRTSLAFEDAYKRSGKEYGREIIGCKEHAALALRSAQESLVLMQNENHTLPFNKEKVHKIVVLGALGNADNTGDHGSGYVIPAYSVTPLEGIKNLLPDVEIVFYEGEQEEHIKELASSADAVVVVAGYGNEDEGEYTTEVDEENYTDSWGGDRCDGLGLKPEEIRIIKAAGEANPATAVVLIGGGTIMINEWKDSVSSILMAFYPGQEGGNAIAQILFGDVNPSGKLPFVLPREESDLPKVNWDTTDQFYGYYHGYAKLDKDQVEPLLPYGFGLSYTQFKIDEAEFGVDGQQVTATCRVTNTGDLSGAEVVQMYVGFENSVLDRPIRKLRGFQRVQLEPGESKTVTISCPIESLKYYNQKTAAFELESMEYVVYIGNAAADTHLIKGIVSL